MSTDGMRLRMRQLFGLTDVGQHPAVVWHRQRQVAATVAEGMPLHRVGALRGDNTRRYGPNVSIGRIGS
jgi:hypothetical protein